MTPPGLDSIAQLLGLVGTLIGSTVAAVLARRTLSKSTSVKNELDGNGNEPSLREMIKASHELCMCSFKDLHEDFIRTSDRLTGVEGRIAAVEAKLDEKKDKET